MLDTLFTLNLRVNLSGAEAVLIRDYLREQTGQDKTIGHLLEPLVQEMVNEIARKALRPEKGQADEDRIRSGRHVGPASTGESLASTTRSGA